MPLYQDIAPPVPITFEAEDAVVFNRFVKLGSVGNDVAAVDGITDVAMGVAVESADPAVGNAAASVWPLNRGGIVPIESAAAITLGDNVAPSANGRGQTAVSTQFTRGVALAAAGGAGEVIPMLVQVEETVIA